jgi:hypothetical protein
MLKWLMTAIETALHPATEDGSDGLGEAVKGLQWKPIAVVLIGGIAAVAISFYAGWSARDHKRLPEILATLPGIEQGFGRIIDERLRGEFPVGSSEYDLVSYLDAEGFVPEWHRRSDQNAAVFVHDGILCTKTVRVLWRADRRGKLTNISGGYASHCVTDPPAR